MKNLWHAFGFYAFYMLPILLIFPIQYLGKNDYPYTYSGDFLSYQSLVGYVCLLMLARGLFFIYWLYWELDSVATGVATVKDVKRLDFDYVPTIATLLAFVTFDYSTWRGFVIFLILMIFLAFVAMNTSLFYTSPLFPCIGIRLYEVTSSNNGNMICLVKGPLKQGNQMYCTRLMRNIYYCKVPKS